MFNDNEPQKIYDMVFAIFFWVYFHYITFTYYFLLFKSYEDVINIMDQHDVLWNNVIVEEFSWNVSIFEVEYFICTADP